VSRPAVEILFPDGRRRRLEPGASLVFGRSDDGAVVGLNARDAGISKVAGEFRLESTGLVKVFNHCGRTPLSVVSTRMEGESRLRPGSWLWLDTDATVFVVGSTLDRYRVQVAFRARGETSESHRNGAGDTVTERAALTTTDLGALVALCRPMLLEQGGAATNAQAAHSLHVSQKTFETRLERAVSKLAALWDPAPVPARNALCAELIRRGVISVADLSASS
jgi:hypothetical protein